MGGWGLKGPGSGAPDGNGFARGKLREVALSPRGGVKLREGLFHLEDEALEVFAFGVGDVDGVIGGLCQLVQDAHPTSGLD